ncbi:MAG: transposase [Betaproteobacteria bacterium]|nr:transposase [Betaproteobacteria bacterium]
MPRLPRTVFAGLPHHVTQRGNRREDVFFTDEDREAYLTWLREYCDKYKLAVLAYCLMTNHIHLIVVPTTVDGLQRVLKPLHMRYAQRINRARNWKGHLWQGRFFSSPLDEIYLLAAVRYVERNPVRAGMVERAEDYRWSSAAAHCGDRSDNVLNLEPDWRKQFAAIDDWSAWLSEADEIEKIRILRQNVEKGLPCGNESFVQRLGKIAERHLEYHPQGRPKKSQDDRKG